MSLDTCPDAPVLRRRGFKLRGHDFTTEGGPRVEGATLSNLFFPERLRLQNEQRHARDEAARLFSKQFFQAQLRWYGIPFDATATRLELKELLKDAVVRNKCNEVPDSVVELERSMRNYYKPALQAWTERFDAWDAEREKLEEQEAWDIHTDPGEKATADLDRFMNHYFLTNGEPDRAGGHHPLALPLFGFEAREELRSLAEGIPGLETATGGDKRNETICIGWSRAAVKSMARQIHKKAKKSKQKHMTLAMRCAYARYHDLLKEMRRVGGPMINKKSIEPANLQKCRGSYMIVCTEVSRKYRSKQLCTLDIGRGPLPTIALGAIHLPHFEGSMLFSFSESILVDYTSHDGHSREKNDIYEDENSDWDDDGPAYGSPGSRNKKSSPRLAESSRKRKRDAEELDDLQIARRARVELSKQAALRVFLRIQGEDAEGNIYTSPKRGYFDFTDEVFGRFEGKIELPHMGQTVRFRGYKVSPLVKKSIEPWKKFFSSLDDS